jgi:hypothetical protein
LRENLCHHSVAQYNRPSLLLYTKLIFYSCLFGHYYAFDLASLLPLLGYEQLVILKHKFSIANHHSNVKLIFGGSTSKSNISAAVIPI